MAALSAQAPAKSKEVLEKLSDERATAPTPAGSPYFDMPCITEAEARLLEVHHAATKGTEEEKPATTPPLPVNVVEIRELGKTWADLNKAADKDAALAAKELTSKHDALQKVMHDLQRAIEEAMVIKAPPPQPLHPIPLSPAAQSSSAPQPEPATV